MGERGTPYDRIAGVCDCGNCEINGCAEAALATVRSWDEDAHAAAWELEGMLGLPFKWEQKRMYLDEEALDAWWLKNREPVITAYRAALAEAGGDRGCHPSWCECLEIARICQRCALSHNHPPAEAGLQP